MEKQNSRFKLAGFTVVALQRTLQMEQADWLIGLRVIYNSNVVGVA